jgi:hypothetical protein
MIALSCQPNHDKTFPSANRIEFEIDYSDQVLSLDNVYTYLCVIGVKYPDIATRQCILETGWLESYNCIARKNLFGMRGGEVTEDNPNGYMIYKDWKHSCRSYLRWQRHWYGDSTQDYYDFLDGIGYAESPTYIDKLKSIKLIVVKK